MRGIFTTSLPQLSDGDVVFYGGWISENLKKKDNLI
jgi:hypothetical protein